MKKRIILSLIALGITATITQLVLLREFLAIFSGNELVFGIVLASWLLFTALGSFFARFIKQDYRTYSVAQVLVGLLPFFTILALRSLRNVLFLPGMLLGLQHVLLYSLFLVPFCLVSGYMLVIATGFLKNLPRVYFTDTAADLLGGLLFSFILVFLLNHFQIFYLLLFINLAMAFYLLSEHISYRVVIAALALLFVFISINYDLNLETRQLLYPNEELLEVRDTLYGNLVITGSGNQINFYENGFILFSSNQTMENEEVAHYAMSQHPNPRRVLLFSGGITGILDEIRKYPVEQIDYVELDPEIITLADEYLDVDYSDTEIISEDARHYVKQSKEIYDVVIINLPGPETAQLNRMYTVDFFMELQHLLTKDSVVSLMLPYSENYITEENRQLISSVYNTLKKMFANVLILPGQQLFLIASDSGLNYNIPVMLDARDIETDYVKYYFEDKLLRQEFLEESLSTQEENYNYDFRPVSYYYSINYWLSFFGIKNLIFYVIGFLILLQVMIFVLRVKPLPYAVFSTGIFSLSSEVILLLAFQIIYGYVYSMVGIIVTLFMFGLALGVFLAERIRLNRRTRKQAVVMNEIIIIIFALLLPAALIFIKETLQSSIIFLALVFIMAFIAGMEFPLASKLHHTALSNKSSTFFFADLFGASIGALIISTFFVPLFGITLTLVIIAAVKASSLFYLLIKFQHL